MDQYDAIAGYYKGWTLTEIRSLSPRERQEWIHRAVQHTADRASVMTRES